MADKSETFRGTRTLPDLDATARLGAGIAGGLKRGDAVALWGDLGAGKTTLARAILRALGVAEDVPSPTFTIVQRYETPLLAVAHYDLYRLKSPREMDELGLDDALDEGAALVEWPERAPEALPVDALHVRLGVQDGVRTARLTGPKRWSSMSDRQDAMQDFLKASGWGAASVAPLPGDASTRRYARLSLNGRGAMLMDQPQGAEPPVAPPGASAEERRALGYNAVARLAGADCARFAAASEYLRGHGLAAPEVFAADYANGFLILEDLGDALFADVLADGGDENTLYKSAIEVLAKLHAMDAPAALAADKPLFAYDETALLAETDLLTEWFLPLALGRATTAEETAEHRALWKATLDQIGNGRRVFVHRDYHAQNLLWLPDRSGVARVGLIDFQDAVAGSVAYDLVSLTEDARHDVSPAVADAATRHYLDTLRAQGTPVDEAQFRREMAIMAAQRNAKIVGIFARLYKRDGKARYLALLPRVWGHLERDLAHPALAPLRTWYDRVIPTHRRSLPEPS